MHPLLQRVFNSFIDMYVRVTMANGRSLTLGDGTCRPSGCALRRARPTPGLLLIQSSNSAKPSTDPRRFVVEEGSIADVIELKCPRMVPRCRSGCGRDR